MSEDTLNSIYFSFHRFKIQSWSKHVSNCDSFCKLEQIPAQHQLLLESKNNIFALCCVHILKYYVEPYKTDIL